MNYQQVVTRVGDEEFDPKHKLFDFMLYRVAKEAFSKSFRMPFRLQFVDANRAFIKETMLEAVDGNVFEEYVRGSGSRGPYQFPYTCNLSDADGQKCAYILSVELMRQVMETGNGPLTFPVDPTDLF